MDTNTTTGRTLLDERQAAEHYRVKPGTLSQWRWAGKGPAYVKIGGRVFYDLHDLDAWLESRRHVPSSAA